MTAYQYIALHEKPEIKDAAAQWFHSKWGVPTEAYLECMDSYLGGETEYGWYLCLVGERIAGGLGVIENDFHDRKDLAAALFCQNIFDYGIELAPDPLTSNAFCQIARNFRIPRRRRNVT